MVGCTACAGSHEAYRSEYLKMGIIGSQITEWNQDLQARTSLFICVYQTDKINPCKSKCNFLIDFDQIPKSALSCSKKKRPAKWQAASRRSYY
jgi:hypothetical protein